MNNYLEVVSTLAVSKLKGIGPVKARNILQNLNGHLSDELDPEEFIRQLLPSDADLVGLGLERALEAATNAVEFCQENNIQIVSFGCNSYPKRLNDAANNMPVALFIRGNPERIHDSTIIAVVGTRDPSDWGQEVCRRITSTLVGRDATIVSGLALGCDQIAHSQTIKNGGKTIAVMPCGLDVVHPKTNTALAEEILEADGCLVSEYFPGVTARREYFVQRNRIQSGLSQGVIVVETGKKGGTMTTAQLCLKHGRQLGVVDPSSSRNLNCGLGNQSLIATGKVIKLSDRESVIDFVDSFGSNLSGTAA